MSLDFQHLLDLKATLDSGLDTFTQLLKDKTIDLDDRWRAYCKLVAKDILVKEDTYGDGFITELGLDNPMDDLNMERHETRPFSDLLDYIDDDKLDPDLVDRWKEAVLQAGYSHFTWDW